MNVLCPNALEYYSFILQIWKNFAGIVYLLYKRQDCYLFRKMISGYYYDLKQNSKIIPLRKKQIRRFVIPEDHVNYDQKKLNLLLTQTKRIKQQMSFIKQRISSCKSNKYNFHQMNQAKKKMLNYKQTNSVLSIKKQEKPKFHAYELTNLLKKLNFNTTSRNNSNTSSFKVKNNDYVGKSDRNFQFFSKGPRESPVFQSILNHKRVFSEDFDCKIQIKSLMR